MSQPDETDHHPARHSLEQQVSAKERQKIEARQQEEHSVWFGLGMFGLVGWSVAVPALIGVALGWWIDSHWPSRYSWTLTLLVSGVVLGCLIAWRWVRQESEVEPPQPQDQQQERR